jgi:crossover junction endodeoxyribonuclease RuvC
MRIISIDPGYERLGIAVIGKVKGEKEELIFSECFKTSSKLSHAERLRLIGDRVKEVIKKYKPKAMAIEKLFFSENQKTALLVSEARGVILYVGKSAGLDVFEYAPNEVKSAITGYGKSEKRQVIFMVEKLITFPRGLASGKRSDDEFDAIAIGLTHFAIHRYS